MLVPKDIAARGARIRFVEAGEEEGTGGRRKKMPLLLLHDFCATREMWSATIEKLAERFHVLAPDLPGFGASEKPDPQRYAYGWDAFASSLYDLVASLGLGRIHVCGHGMGGGVALALAAKHASLVHKLVLTSALVYPPKEHALERTGRLPLVGALVWRQAMGRALFRSYVHKAIYSGAQRMPPGRADELYDVFNTPGARQAAHATLVAKADTRPLVAHLPRVTADTLVVWGRDDIIAPIEHGRRLARELHARFEVLECGRCPPDEQPDAFAATLRTFLETPIAEEPEDPPKSKKGSTRKKGSPPRVTER